jgi:hypothetical protein
MGENRVFGLEGRCSIQLSYGRNPNKTVLRAVLAGTLGAVPGAVCTPWLLGLSDRFIDNRPSMQHIWKNVERGLDRD